MYKLHQQIFAITTGANIRHHLFITRGNIRHRSIITSANFRYRSIITSCNIQHRSIITSANIRHRSIITSANIRHHLNVMVQHIAAYLVRDNTTLIFGSRIKFRTVTLCSKISLKPKGKYWQVLWKVYSTMAILFGYLGGHVFSSSPSFLAQTVFESAHILFFTTFFKKKFRIVCLHRYTHKSYKKLQIRIKYSIFFNFHCTPPCCWYFLDILSKVKAF